MKHALRAASAVAVALVIFGCRGGERRQQPAREGAGGDRVRVYVTNERGGDVSVIDASADEIVSTIPVGKRPRGVLLSRDGRRIYVALSGSPIGGPNVRDEDLPPADKKADGIGVVDVVTGKFVGKIVSGSDPELFSLSDDGRYMYVANEDVGEASVVDVAAGKIVKTLKVGYEPEGVATSPDGRWVYVTGESSNTVHVVDTRTNEIAAVIQTPGRPRAAAFLPDSSKAYVTCETGNSVAVVDVAAAKVVKEIKPPGENVRPMGVVVSPDARRVYVTTGRGKSVVVIDTAEDEVEAVIPDVGDRPWGIGVTPDGRKLYTANGPSNDVSVIDTGSLKVVKRIQAGQSPWGVAVGRD
jgi:YVTN family beta-propeller protein